MSRKHGELGKHEQKKASFEQQIEDRKNIVKDTSRRHNIRGYETNLNDGRVQEYIRKINKLSTEQEITLEKAQKETEREIERAQEVLRGLNEQKSNINAEQNSSKQQVATNDQTTRNARSELSQMNGDEGDIAVIESKIEQLELNLKKARDESEAADWNKKIQENESYFRKLEEEINRLNDELIKATKQAGDVAHLDHLKKELVDSQRSLDKMKSVHKDKLQSILNHKWQPSCVEEDFQNALHEKSQQVKDTERQRASVCRDLEQIDIEIQNVLESLDNSRKKRDACERLLREVVEEPGGYPTELAEIQEGRDVLKSDADGFVHLRSFYEQAINLAESRHKCRLCTRNFIDSKEIQQFVNVLKKKMKEDDFAKTKNDLSSQEELLRKAKEVGPAYDTWIRLTRGDLPRLENASKDLSAKRTVVMRVVEEHDQAVDDRELAKADVDSLAKPVANIVKYDQEIVNLSGQIQHITDRQKDGAFPRALEEIRQQLDSVNKDFKNAATTKDKLSTDKERLRSTINNIELELVNARGSLSGAKHQLEKRTAKLRQIKDLSSASQMQRNTIRELDDQLRKLIPQTEAEEDRLDDIKQRGRQKEASLRDEASKLVDSVRRLNQAEAAIRKYVDEGGEAEMTKCLREIESTEMDIQRTDQEQKKVIKSLNKITEELSNQKETKRTIEDNISYRRNLRDLENIKAEIVQLSAQNAEADQQHWRDEADRWQHKLNKLSTQQTSKLGAAKAKDDQLASLIEDWNTDYKDAAYNYKKAHIEVEVS